MSHCTGWSFRAWEKTFDDEGGSWDEGWQEWVEKRASGCSCLGSVKLGVRLPTRLVPSSKLNLVGKILSGVHILRVGGWKAALKALGKTRHSWFEGASGNIGVIAILSAVAHGNCSCSRKGAVHPLPACSTIANAAHQREQWINIRSISCQGLDKYIYI